MRSRIPEWAPGWREMHLIGCDWEKFITPIKMSSWSATAVPGNKHTKNMSLPICQTENISRHHYLELSSPSVPLHCRRDAVGWRSGRFISRFLVSQSHFLGIVVIVCYCPMGVLLLSGYVSMFRALQLHVSVGLSCPRHVSFFVVDCFVRSLPQDTEWSGEIEINMENSCSIRAQEDWQVFDQVTWSFLTGVHDSRAKLK